MATATDKPPVGWRRVMDQGSDYDLRSHRDGWLALIGPHEPYRTKLVLVKSFEEWEEAVSVANGVMGR